MKAVKYMVNPLGIRQWSDWISYRLFFLFAIRRFMILNRLGNKSKIAKKIQSYFPDHSVYIEPFFGAGGMFFNKPKVKYNFLNDLDSDVYNLFMVLMNRKQELKEMVKSMPIHMDLLQYWKNHMETDPLKRALRFLFLSNYLLYGTARVVRFALQSPSKILYQNIDRTHDFLFGCKFLNTDFRDMFKKISFKDEYEKDKAFIYCDPPYLDTTNSYGHSFTEEDIIDLFDVLQGSGIRWAMSFSDHPFIFQEAEDRGLQVVRICDRKSINNRLIEVLVINYPISKRLFD